MRSLDNPAQLFDAVLASCGSIKPVTQSQALIDRPSTWSHQWGCRSLLRKDTKYPPNVGKGAELCLLTRSLHMFELLEKKKRFGRAITSAPGLFSRP
jgi:hypothetical protein